MHHALIIYSPLLNTYWISSVSVFPKFKKEMLKGVYRCLIYDTITERYISYITIPLSRYLVSQLSLTKIHCIYAYSS